MADVVLDADNKSSEELMNIGIRAYIVQDYNGAVTALCKSIELMVAEHGEKHDALGNVYLYYGKALLEVSREESEALGDAVGRKIDSDSEDETNNENEAGAEDNQVTESKITNGVEEEKAGTKTPADTEDGIATSKAEENGENGVENKVAAAEEPSSSGAVDAEGSGKENEENLEEEPTDLQLAWEVLELAKLIFEQRADVGKIDLADTLVTLGEVSMESENFESAIADIKQGLEIQKQILDPDSRLLAETYYKLAVACSTNNQIDDAIKSFNDSLNVLNTRINMLKQTEEKEKNEIKDIETLIPEIEEKIADMKNYKEEAANKLALAMMTMPFEGKSEGAGSSGQAKDITHLVKRKRKLEDIAEQCQENHPTKKPPST